MRTTSRCGPTSCGCRSRTGITPKIEKRRYDTRFFLAEMPAGQDADAETSEVETAQWYGASAALTDWTAGKHSLLPPTWTQLRELAAYDSVADPFAARRDQSRSNRAPPTTISKGYGSATPTSTSPR